MWIEELDIRNCRCIEKASIKLSPTINIFYGKNASGKSSILEALCMLSTGRSFRTPHISDVIRYKKESIISSALLNHGDDQFRIGIEKSKNKTKIRINNNDVFSQAELSRRLPITIIHPLSVNILTGSPVTRRTYLDWICFYLYPEFHKKLRSYNHILKQRNLCLKDVKHQYALKQWTEKLVSFQPDIIKLREQALSLLLIEFKLVNRSLFQNRHVNILSKNGFSSDVSTDDLSEKVLLDYYQKREKHDIYTKRTTAGIHLSDLKITINGSPAEISASRGELKLLSISLYIAQNILLYRESGLKPIILIDDFTSELDETNSKKLLNFLLDIKHQIIITCLKSDDIAGLSEDSYMFHVEHGEIKRQERNHIQNKD